MTQEDLGGWKPDATPSTRASQHVLMNAGGVAVMCRRPHSCVYRNGGTALAWHGCRSGGAAAVAALILILHHDTSTAEVTRAENCALLLVAASLLFVRCSSFDAGD